MLMMKLGFLWIGGLVLLLSLHQVTASVATPAVEVISYAFKCGILRTQTQYMLKDTRVGTPFDAPVPFFLIKHGRDWVAFDTGNNARVAVDPAAYWYEKLYKAYSPVMKPEEAFVEQIKTLGITPRDIKAVIISHGHLDHAGSIESFRGTGVPIYFQKAEMAEIRKAIDARNKGTAYILDDFKYVSELNIREIEGMFDLFGDKTVIAIPTPGHTQGHQSLYVKPSKGKPFIYAADALYTLEGLEKMIPPGLAFDEPLTMLNVSWLRFINDAGNIEIVPSHDPAYWAKKAWGKTVFTP